jgi:hypothetical protein
MRDTLWNRVVTVDMGDNRVYSIRTSREAAWCLLDDWPAEKGASYRNALEGCASALKGHAPDVAVRFLFVSAALDAKFLVATSADILEHDTVLSDLTEMVSRDLFERDDPSETWP